MSISSSPYFTAIGSGLAVCYIIYRLRSANRIGYVYLSNRTGQRGKPIHKGTRMYTFFVVTCYFWMIVFSICSVGMFIIIIFDSRLSYEM